MTKRKKKKKEEEVEDTEVNELKWIFGLLVALRRR